MLAGFAEDQLTIRFIFGGLSFVLTQTSMSDLERLDVGLIDLLQIGNFSIAVGWMADENAATRFNSRLKITRFMITFVVSVKYIGKCKNVKVNSRDSSEYV